MKFNYVNFVPDDYKPKFLYSFPNKSETIIMPFKNAMPWNVYYYDIASNVALFYISDSCALSVNIFWENRDEKVFIKEHIYPKIWQILKKYIPDVLYKNHPAQNLSEKNKQQIIEEVTDLFLVVSL